MSKKEEEKKIEPVYEWANEEGEEDITPAKRKILKSMPITESFTYYDALAYVMKMEKARDDKKAEIHGLEEMIKAYRDELEIIEKALNVDEIDKKWNLELHKKLKAEADEKKEKGEVVEEEKKEEGVESPYLNE